MGELLVEHSHRVVTLTINRQEAFNSLNAAVLEQLAHEVQAAAISPSVRAVVVTGAGEKAFSAGADLKEIATMDVDRAHAAMRLGQHVFRSIELAPIPVITAVNGLALGGGFELILASTIPILSSRAVLGLPESGLGLIPGYGGTQRLPAAVGARVAAHLMLTGERLSAERAYALGLTPIPPVGPENLASTAAATADRIASQGPYAVRSILQAMSTAAGAPTQAGLNTETGLAALAIAGAESTEGITAFLERRPTDFPDPPPDDPGSEVR